ncbi:MAG: TolC family protein [Candidatus Omnitrophica bacterium]|nr:TolC family protein [Candidatus Omnitrophota bacterium]
MIYKIPPFFRKITVVLTVVVVFCPAPFGICKDNGSQTVISSVNDAMDTAFSNNKDIKIQEKELNVARANILGAKSEFLPQLSSQASYTHNGAVLNVGSSIVNTTKKDLGVVTGYNNDNKIGVSLDQIVYNGGANVANLRQNELNLKVAEQTLRATKLDVEFETKRLYYGLLLAYETLRITQELVDQAELHYENVKDKFNHGTASRFDVLQSKVHVAKLLPELVKARNAVKLMKEDLKKIIGVDMKSTIDVNDALTYKLMPLNEKEFLKEAYLNKPEMILKSLGIDISQWGIKLARSNGLAQINADLGYYYRSNDVGDMFNNRHSNWSAGVVVRMPIFDGFATKAKVDEAKAKYAKAILSKENVSDQIQVDIKKACLDLKQAFSIIKSQRASIIEARDALRIAEVGYDNGVDINLDVLDAQVSLGQVQQNLASAIYDYLMAEAYLKRTMGQGYIKEVKNEPR